MGAIAMKNSGTEPDFIFHVNSRPSADQEDGWVWFNLLVRNLKQALPGSHYYSACRLGMRAEDFERFERCLGLGDDSIQIRERGNVPRCYAIHI